MEEGYFFLNILSGRGEKKKNVLFFSDTCSEWQMILSLVSVIFNDKKKKKKKKDYTFFLRDTSNGW